MMMMLKQQQVKERQESDSTANPNEAMTVLCVCISVFARKDPAVDETRHMQLQDVPEREAQRGVTRGKSVDDCLANLLLIPAGAAVLQSKERQTQQQLPDK